MQSLKVIEIGSKVVIGEDVTAIITGVMIETGGAVSYRCNWWNARARCSEWLVEQEVQQPVDAVETRIGFGRNGRQSLRAG